MAYARSQLEKREAARKDIDRLLSSPLSDEEWGLLIEEDDAIIYDIVESHSSSARKHAIEVAARKVRRTRIVYSTRSKKEKVSMLSEQEVKRPMDRSEVVSILVAQEVNEDENVHLFRSEVLGDRLLSLEGVDTWIQQQAQMEGPPTAWLVDVPLAQAKVSEYFQRKMGSTPDASFVLEVSAEQIKKTRGIRGHILRYTVPDDEWERSIAIAIGGVLERLQQLSEQLEEQYAWAQAQATTFILTGSTPWVSPLSFTQKRNAHPLLNRIVLEVDPMVLPEVVIKCYSDLRKEMLPRRPRNLSEKHMQLAIFASRQWSGTWAEKMAIWNEEHPEWEYKKHSNFSHDCIQARRRLLFS